MALLICPECGNRVSDRSDVCLKCGYPTKDIIVLHNQVKKRKSLFVLLIVSTCVIAVLAIILVLNIVLSPDKSGYFDGNRWGTPYQEVSAKYSDIFGTNDENSSFDTFIDPVDGFSNEPFIATFYFDDGKLYKVSLLIMSNDGVELDSVKMVKDYLTQLYGTPELSHSSTKEWNTAQSQITLWHYKSMISVTYEDSSL